MDKSVLDMVLEYLRSTKGGTPPTSTAGPLPPNAAPTYAGNPQGQGAAGNAMDVLRTQKARRDAAIAAAGG